MSATGGKSAEPAKVQEAKQRRAPVASEQAAPTFGAIGATDCVLWEADKGRRSWVGAARAGAAHVLRGLRRRRVDIVATGALWSSWVLGYWYATHELLQPQDALPARLLSVLCHCAFVLAILSWLGVILHGPGSVPVEERTSQLPSELAAALAVGRFSNDRPFGPGNQWCGACSHWKPPLAHHCSICGHCSLWMDHHCNFASQCIGFRNLRCFIVMLFYTQALGFLFVPVVVRHFLIEPAIDDWAIARLLVFVLAWFGLMRFVRFITKNAISKAAAGWPSQILLAKYQGVLKRASEVERMLAARVQAGVLVHQLPALREASQQLQHRKGGGVRGFFKAEDLLGTLALVFGEPFSWRWLLPLLPGGSGDPLQPLAYDTGACNAWATLAEALESCNAMLAAEQEAASQRAGLWSKRVEALLANAERVTSSCPPGTTGTHSSALMPTATQAAAPPALAHSSGDPPV